MKCLWIGYRRSIIQCIETKSAFLFLFSVRGRFLEDVRELLPKLGCLTLIGECFEAALLDTFVKENPKLLCEVNHDRDTVRMLFDLIANVTLYLNFQIAIRSMEMSDLEQL
jgi:hypothetical protein